MSRPRPSGPGSRTPGAYLLLFRLPRLDGVDVARLGRYDLPAGIYAYAGSALGGLEARVGRHLAGKGTRHWHIDYLLEHAVDRGAYILPSDRDIECELADQVAGIEGATRPIKGLGSSDCRCFSHLFHLTPTAVLGLERRMGERGAAYAGARLGR